MANGTTTTLTTTMAIATAPSLTTLSTVVSAFEQHKAHRRNNKHYGHKTHKKKYKDYRQYALTTTTTTATATKTTTTTSAPATILANRNTNDYGADVVADVVDAVNATKAKLTNNTRDNYRQQQERHVEKLRKHAAKIEAEKSHGLPASPIFVVANRNARDPETNVEDSEAKEQNLEKADDGQHTTKPFYEGQINYYLETADDDDTVGGYEKMSLSNVRQRPVQQRQDNMDGSWYRRVSPVLRNGIKTAYGDGKQEEQQQEQRHSNHHRRQKPQQHHHHSHHRNHHHKHRQYGKHHPTGQWQQQQTGAHQRKTSSNSNAVHPTPLPPPSYKPHDNAMQELGHQITQLEEYERYYAKWPHLARVQFQVYDEHYREAHPELYPEYDYESAAELEEAENEKGEDANLPPYIKKYNRRNKQLLNLLEGTLPPPTRPPWSNSLLQPGPHESSASSGIRLDDDYMKQKRLRYHNRVNSNANRYHDLFAQQRSSTASITTTSAAPLLANWFESSAEKPRNLTTLNNLPDEDVSVSQEHLADFWQPEIESKSNANGMAGSQQMTSQIEKLATSVPAAPSTTPKAALFRLPSYPAIAGSFLGKPRSRSAQFAPSTGSRATSSFISRAGYGTGGGGNYNSDAPDTRAVASTTTSSEADGNTTAPNKAINSFVYHRVIDASPRLVGAGSTGRKQRLPFVAITDRRLETSKKTLLERQKDFEQNHFPMP